MNEIKSEEPKSDAGSILRQKRMLRGASIEAVHQQTRIPKKLLEALEDNRIDAFPAPVYLRGFLKGYCDYLEVDFEPLWRQLAPNAQESQPDEEQASTEAEDKMVPGTSGPPSSAPPLKESTLVPFILLAALLLTAAVFWGMRATKTQTAASQRPLPAAITPISPSGEPTLRLNANRDTWIKLKVDGRLEFEGRFPSGTSKDWKAKKEFALRASNPADLQIFIDDKEILLDRFPADPDGFRLITR